MKSLKKNIKLFTLLAILLFSRYTYAQTDFQLIINSVNPDSLAWFIQELEDFGTRHYAHENRFEVSSWVENQFIRLGYTNVVQDTFYMGDVHGYKDLWQTNVIATIAGSVFPDQYIIIGAHHDSGPNRNDISNPNAPAPGADDNASGVAALLEIARIMRLYEYEPRTSIRFITYAAEEAWMYGSYHDVEKIKAEDMDLIAMINVDMIGYAPDDNWIFSIVNHPDSDHLTELSLYFGEQMNMNITLTPNYPGDNIPYTLAGYPVIYFREYGLTPHYHLATDLLVNLDIDYATNFTKLIAWTLLYYSELPKFIDGYVLSDVGDGQSIKATWRTSKHSAGAKFKFIVKNMDDMSLREITTDQSQLIIDDLIEGNLYEVIFKLEYENHTNSGIVKHITPIRVPHKISNFIGKVSFFNSIQFSWQAGTDLDLAGYKIFRRINDTEHFFEIVTLPKSTVAWTDHTGADGVWYDYIIKGFNTDGNLGISSDILSFVKPAIDDGVLVINFFIPETSSGVSDKIIIDNVYNMLLLDMVFERIDLPVNPPTSVELAKISTILIHNDSEAWTHVPTLITLLKSFIDNGKNIIFSNLGLSYVLDSSIEYPKDFNSTVFQNEYLGIRTVNRNQNLHMEKAISTGYWKLPELDIDRTKMISYTFENNNYQLSNLEYFIGDRIQPLYTNFTSINTPPIVNFNNNTIAYYTNKGKSHIIVTSIPFYYIKDDQAKEFFNIAFENFKKLDVNIDPNEELLISTKDFGLHTSNYPNPFNPETTIQFRIDYLGVNISSIPVQVDIFNIKGQKVKSLVSEHYPAGNHSVIWNGTDDMGKDAGSGVYFYRVKAGEFNETKKMLLIK